jgi:hypothetical protein
MSGEDFSSKAFGGRLQTINNALNAVAMRRFLRAPRAFECVRETAWLDLKRRGKAIKRENLLGRYSHG